MPLSYAQYQGNGSQKNFDVPCEYLSKSHITVRVDGVDVPFSWVDTFRLITTTAPAADTVVEVRRTTPREDRLVTFTDGSTLVETDLNTSTLQSFFLAQEAFDQGAASMGVTEDGQFSALLRRITNLADPVALTDAVSKGWALETTNTNVSLAVAAKDRAVQAENTSVAARDTTQSYRDQAIAARDVTTSAKTDTEAARDAAASSSSGASSQRGLAQSARDAAEGFRNEAQDARDATVTLRDEAQEARDEAVEAATSMLIPSGMIAPFARSTAPTGWLAANGAAVSRTTFADLFLAIGTTFGVGNGSTTFNLPDLRGEFIRGLDAGRGVDVNRQLGSAQAQDIQGHTHTATATAAGEHTHNATTASAGGHSHTLTNETIGYDNAGNRSWIPDGAPNQGRVTSGTNAAGDHTHTITVNNAGNHTHQITVAANTGTETRPRNVALLYCIKA